jgi:hypothetical protein
MPVYAPLDKENFPHETELKVTEMQRLEGELLEHSGRYQVGMERRVMGSQWEPEYRYIVVKWESDFINTAGNKRNVLLETTDPDQVIATLKMLLSIEREPR